MEPGGGPLHAPTVIFFYGKQQTMAAPRAQIIFRALRTMGANVFIPDFPGYGMSEGSPSENRFYATADATLDYLLSRDDIDHRRIIAAGMSLGSGTAIDLASRRPLAGVISIGGFTNAADTVAAYFAWMPQCVAESLTSECRFDNLAKIRTVSCPILLIYGIEDSIIPLWMTDRLAKTATAQVTRIAVPSVHNDLWKNERFGLNASLHDWIQAR
jgi:pimeloyl-ACP methyl ester carboxylesterase